MTVERTVMCMAACLVLMAPSLGAAGEKRPHPKVGSFWNYEETNEIKGIKYIVEQTLTETSKNERVTRMGIRGTNNPQIVVFDNDWGEIQIRNAKYQPSRTWMPKSLEVGAKSSREGTYSIQRATSWSDPTPMTIQSEVTAAETVTTKAGRFETYRVETITRFSPKPETPFTHDETKNVVWFAPRIDHWVKADHEARRNGRLLMKTTQTLIEYKVR